MKIKRIGTIVACTLVAIVGLLLGACSNNNASAYPLQLATPTALRVQNGALVWAKVNFATEYAVYINDDVFLTEDTQFFLSDFTEEGKEYELGVRAICGNGKYANSEIVKITHIAGQEIVPTPDLEYKLLSDRKGYEVSRGVADLKGEIVIPDYYYDLPVKKIAKYGFGTDKTLQVVGSPDNTNYVTTGVRLPDTLEEIGENAFSNCASLTDIKIPESVVKIGNCAFKDCLAIKSIALPPALTELPDEVFSGTSLSAITFPDGLNKIGKEAFYRTNFTSLTIPEGVTSIGEGAFESCSALTEISLPDTVSRLENKMLYGCSKLADIRFPANIEFVGNSVLHRTQWIEDQPDGIVALNGYMLKYNGPVKDGLINITSEIKHISGGAFINLSSYYVVSVVISDGVTLGSYAFANGDIGFVRLPSDLTVVPDYAFYNSGLKEITLPDGLVEIGDCAFSLCGGLRNIELPNGLKKIGDEVFVHCNQLTTLVIPDSVTQLGSIVYSSDVKTVISPKLLATRPPVILIGIKTIGIYVTCSPEECEYNFSVWYSGPLVSIYLYVENKNDLPDDGGDYWHYADDGVTPTAW